MASKANQGLQIALVIFVVLLVLVCVIAYLLFSNLETAQAKASDFEKRAQQADSERAKLEIDLRDLKTMLGVGPDETMAQVKETHKKDMEAYGKTLADAQLPPAQFPDGQLHYRRWVEYLFTELRAAKSRIDKDALAEKQFNQKIAEDEAATTREVALHKEENAKTATELATEREAFKKARGDFEKLAAEVEQKLKDRTTELDGATKTASAEAELLRKQIAELNAKNDSLIQKIEGDEVLQAKPDGEVTWVNQRERLVWLNLGRDHGLKQQVSFKVVSGDETDPAGAKSKGMIEVVNVGSRQSEAKIIDDEVADPIMPGDKLFSAAFASGMQERFAIMGKIDVNGDGVGDRKLVRELVELNGGIIDAELTDDGRMIGQVTVNTRYLVLGEPPLEDAALKRFSKVIEDVKRFGVQTLKVSDFLDQIGYQAGVRAKALGPGAKASDFPAKLEGGVQRKSQGKTSEFKPRSPKNNGDNSP